VHKVRKREGTRLRTRSRALCDTAGIRALERHFASKTIGIEKNMTHLQSRGSTLGFGFCLSVERSSELKPAKVLLWLGNVSKRPLQFLLLSSPPNCVLLPFQKLVFFSSLSDDGEEKVATLLLLLIPAEPWSPGFAPGRRNSPPPCC